MLAPSPYGPAILSPRTRSTVTPKTTECVSHRDLTGLTGLSTPIAHLGKLRLKGKRNLAQSHTAPLDRAKSERVAAHSLSSSSHAAPRPQLDEAPAFVFSPTIPFAPSTLSWSHPSLSRVCDCLGHGGL